MSIDALSVLRAVDSPSPTDRDLNDIADHMSQFVHSWAKTDHVAVCSALTGELPLMMTAMSGHYRTADGSRSTTQNEQLLRLYAQYYR